MMDRRLELISEMTPAIWVHVIAAFAALLLGAYVLWRRKGTARHKMLGRVWVALMFVVAVSSFGISTIGVVGPFSPIHLLSVYTLGALVLGIAVFRWPSALSRAEMVRRHRLAMQTLYASALLIAGGFTFLPWRLLGRMTFGESIPALNMIITAAMVAGGIWLIVHARRTAHARGTAK